MKKTSSIIISCILLLFLITFWFTRWEQGPIKESETQTLVFKKDRWTKATWVTIYSINKTDENFVPSKNTIKSFQQKHEKEIKEDYQNFLANYQKIEERLQANQQGYQFYFQEANYYMNHPDSKSETSPTMSQFPPLHNNPLLEQVITGCNRSIPSEIEKRLKKEIDEKHLKQKDNYCQANKELIQLQTKINNYSETKLEKHASTIRGLLTIIWASLMIIVCLNLIIGIKRRLFE